MRSPTESIEDNSKKLLTVKDDGILLHKIKPCKTLVPNRTMICLESNMFFGEQACPCDKPFQVISGKENLLQSNGLEIAMFNKY